MASDANLTEVMMALRRRFPDAPEDLLRQIEDYIRADYGTCRVYIEARKKRRHFDVIERAGPDADARALAEKLGLSVSQSRRLRRLR